MDLCELDHCCLYNFKKKKNVLPSDLRFTHLLSSSVYYFTGFITKVTESDELPTRHLQVSHYHIYIYIYIFRLNVLNNYYITA